MHPKPTSSKDQSLAERLWANVVKSDDPDGCWLWNLGATGNGYGAIYEHGIQRPAHVVAYEVTYGDIPTGFYICHTCDVKRCCRPDHLFLGTPTENVQDMIRKGRDHFPGPNNPAHGERHGMARLTEAQVTEIRVRYTAGGTTLQELADTYSVRNSTIFKIIHHQRWKHSD